MQIILINYLDAIIDDIGLKLVCKFYLLGQK